MIHQKTKQKRQRETGNVRVDVAKRAVEKNNSPPINSTVVGWRGEL